MSRRLYREAYFSAFPCARAPAGTHAIQTSHRHALTQAIETYSNAGDLVLDPMCGTGTALVEAIHLGRRAIGVEHDTASANIAHTNVRRALNQHPSERAIVLRGDATKLPHVLTKRAARKVIKSRAAGHDANVEPLAYGRVDLVVISPPRSERHRLKSIYLASATVVTPGSYLVLVSHDGATHNLTVVPKSP